MIWILMNFIGCKHAKEAWNILWFVTQDGTSTMKLVQNPNASCQVWNYKNLRWKLFMLN